MKITEKLRQLLAKRRKTTTPPQNTRLQRQMNYIERLQTPSDRVDAIQKRINNRKARR